MSFKSFSTGSKSEKSDKSAATPPAAQPETKPANDTTTKKT
jgi:hypothetical protein